MNGVGREEEVGKSENNSDRAGMSTRAGTSALVKAGWGYIDEQPAESRPEPHPRATRPNLTSTRDIAALYVTLIVKKANSLPDLALVNGCGWNIDWLGTSSLA
jgi:hypothetical protein